MITSFFLTPRKQKMLVMTGRKMPERKPYAFGNGGKILWLMIKNFLASAQLSDSCGNYASIKLRSGTRSLLAAQTYRYVTLVGIVCIATC
jgi:hypothetical protein